MIRFPRIANFDDFDPLAAEPGVSRRVRRAAEPMAAAERDHPYREPRARWPTSTGCGRTGLAGAIVQLAQSGVAVVGICGGYQMLGR